MNIYIPSRLKDEQEPLVVNVGDIKISILVPRDEDTEATTKEKKEDAPLEDQLCRAADLRETRIRRELFNTVSKWAEEQDRCTDEGQATYDAYCDAMDLIDSHAYYEYWQERG